jgi:hypothetical protein
MRSLFIEAPFALWIGACRVKLPVIRSSFFLCLYQIG